MSLFSKNLRFLRKKGNHMQEDIAVLFQKAANTIGNWENDKSEPSLAELMKLAGFFRVSTQDLLLTDLESLGTLSTTASPDSGSRLPSAASRLPGEATAGSPAEESFWLILKELRALNAKVDLLGSLMAGSGGQINHSDKSYH